MEQFISAIRIVKKYAYIASGKIEMKSRLNITVDTDLMANAKRYAAIHNSSLSQLIENYFKSLVRGPHKKTAIDVLNELPKPKKKFEGDLTKEFMESRKKKYGF